MRLGNYYTIRSWVKSLYLMLTKWCFVKLVFVSTSRSPFATTVIRSIRLRMREMDWLGSAALNVPSGIILAVRSWEMMGLISRCRQLHNLRLMVMTVIWTIGVWSVARAQSIRSCIRSRRVIVKLVVVRLLVMVERKLLHRNSWCKIRQVRREALWMDHPCLCVKRRSRNQWRWMATKSEATRMHLHTL